MEQFLAKAILTLIVVILTLYLFRRDTSQVKAYKKILLLFFVLILILTIFFPESTTTIANFVGIGRGADLIVYVMSIALIFKIVNDSLHQKAEKNINAKIIRRIALLEKEIRNND